MNLRAANFQEKDQSNWIFNPAALYNIKDFVQTLLEENKHAVRAILNFQNGVRTAAQTLFLVFVPLGLWCKVETNKISIGKWNFSIQIFMEESKSGITEKIEIRKIKP